MSLANSLAARCEFVKVLKMNFTEHYVFFALELPTVNVLGFLSRLRTLLVELSVLKS